MSFFEDTTVVDTIEQTIEQVESLEEQEQKKLIKAFRQIRRELQDRLLTVPEGTFTERQLQVTLAQVTAAIEAMKRDLRGQMVESSAIMSERGIGDLINEINKWNSKFSGSIVPLNINRALIATDTKNFLINKHEASIEAYGESLRSQITSNITQAMLLGDTTQRTVGRMVADVGRYFVGEEWRLERIARTELHGIYNFSKMNGMLGVREQTLPDLKKALVHPIDKRTGKDSIALAKENPIVDIDKPFVQRWNGKTRTYMAPPDRPNDRSIMVPYRRVWDK